MILYKYMTAKRLVDLLETEKIRLTQYFDENDPYECSLALLPIEREKDQAVQDDYQAERIELEVSFKAKFFQFGIISLTENFNNVLMWAHYADNHRGVVVGFDINSDFFNSKEKFYDFTYGIVEKDINTEGFGSVKRINYTSNRKHIRLGEYYSLDDIFFTKSIHWSYEGEYRILKNIYNMKPSLTLPSCEEIYLTDIPNSCIREIIFGLRCDEGTINQVNKILKSKLSTDVALSRAKLAHLTYDIQLQQLNFT